ncbi:hypothetical protein [Halosegnis marinus]|uniref:DUF7961 domain-containing protein n=1 Tax=Halosegnis marinus TaxID=3034023 RepID=A0ABD5ZS00_9EURY|nr:hypothetical protein [Halosegnis sp. DT85]
MSTGSFGSAVASCRPSGLQPVTLPASALDSTAPEYLRDLRRELADEDRTPAELTLAVAFDEDCSFATQETVERVRDHVRAAAQLGAGRVSVTVEAVADESKVEPALSAARERARREGVTLAVERAE